MGIKARLIQEVGTRAFLRIYWGDNCPGHGGYSGFHNAQRHLIDSQRLEDWELGGKPQDHPEASWPTQCDHCGMACPPAAERQVHHKRLYNTASGKPEIGDLYWVTWYPDHTYWDNHKGPMLMALLPDGTEWNIDSRAANCGSPNDRIHRCWCRHGMPPDIHVDKNGLTCSAGGGSIQSHTGLYHGFLHNGEFS